MKPKLGQRTHRVEITTEGAACCSRHECRVARCTCGWETGRRDESADASYAAAAAREHRIDVLLHAVGVKFEVSNRG